MTSYILLYDVTRTSFISIRELIPFLMVIVCGAIVYLLRDEPRLRKAGWMLSVFATIGVLVLVGVDYV